MVCRTPDISYTEVLRCCVASHFYPIPGPPALKYFLWWLLWPILMGLNCVGCGILRLNRIEKEATWSKVGSVLGAICHSSTSLIRGNASPQGQCQSANICDNPGLDLLTYPCKNCLGIWAPLHLVPSRFPSQSKKSSTLPYGGDGVPKDCGRWGHGLLSHLP